jgi:hypothetical protein
MPKTVIAFAAILSLCCGFMTTAASAADILPDQAIANASAAATNWLKFVDENDDFAAWAMGSNLFKARVSEDLWTDKVGPARESLGAVVSRKVNSATFATTLPGAPDGQYVVLKCLTSFDHKKSAVETIVMTLDTDGQWRVAGYYIK